MSSQTHHVASAGAANVRAHDVEAESSRRDEPRHVQKTHRHITYNAEEKGFTVRSSGFADTVLATSDGPLHAEEETDEDTHNGLDGKSTENSSEDLILSPMPPSPPEIVFPSHINGIFSAYQATEVAVQQPVAGARAMMPRHINSYFPAYRATEVAERESEASFQLVMPTHEGGVFETSQTQQPDPVTGAEASLAAILRGYRS